MELGINAHHQTRGQYTHETSLYGAAKKGPKSPRPESLKIRILVAIPPFYLPVACREVPGGGPRFFRSVAFRGGPAGVPWERTLTPNTKRGGNKYAKPP